MNMVDIIIKKRNGGTLSSEEIEWFVEAYTKGEVPDYQASALLMAIYYQHLDEEETFVLTRAMQNSGVTIDLSSIPGIKVDKHSTGGIGDKTTMIVAPIAAACGVPIAKMSGRGLGMTGGTIDKLSAIPGFETSVMPEQFLGNVRQKGIAVIGQSASLAKADKLLYALRDVTGTVEEPSLIASSIMSKKLASGSDAILLDVKCGSGAFMHTAEEAKNLAERMVKIGNASGKRTVAVITGMEQPLGRAAGNSCEVAEAIETLKGMGPADITELSLYLASLMIYLGEKAPDLTTALKMAREVVRNGEAIAKFREFVAAQGGDPAITEDIRLLPRPMHAVDVMAATAGYVARLDAATVGGAVQKAGAGRARKEDEIDLSAGAYLYRKTGEAVKAGDRLARLFGNDKEKLLAASSLLRDAYTIAAQAPAEQELIIETVGLDAE